MDKMKSFFASKGGDNDDSFAKVKELTSAAVVTIAITHPRNFGLDRASSSQATGFVVDKVKGILCSNKHVVHGGPCRAKAKFMKNEELDLLPIYRDPVHDFGFFKFDPSKLTETPLVQIELDPEGAIRGRNALMIGNNGGEKLSFVETTVSRTDRMAVPMHDMNTFYVTASDTSVGGSSGAPLLSTDGKAIAMMAAGSDRTNISLYLPLFRVARALEFIKNEEKVPRGTIQIGFKYQNFDALLKRKAITAEQIELVKKSVPESEGMLVVEKTLPKGPGKLAGLINGDVLFEMNNNIVCNYVALEEILDTFIGKEISLSIIREQKSIEIKPTVQDHEEIEISEFVEISNGIFHALQYKVAAYVNLPIEGVFLAKGGYMFNSVPFASIIKRIGKTDIHNLHDFVEAIKSIENGELVAVRYQPIHDQNKVEIAIITVDKRWYPFQLATRNDKKGKWDYKDLLSNTTKKESKKSKTGGAKIMSTGEASESEVESFTSSLVMVKFSLPFNVDGGYDGGRSTVGIVYDAELGLVITSREAIGTTLADVQLTFNKSKTIHAKPIFIHPETPVTILKYDPQLLAEDPTVTVTSVTFSDVKPTVGELLDYVGVNNDFEFRVDEARVTNFRDVDIFGGEMLGHSMATVPNEFVGFNSTSFGMGVFLDKKTHLVKAYSLFNRGGGGRASLATDTQPIIEQVRDSVKNSTPMPQSIRMLPITTTFIPLHEARINELSDEWAQKLQGAMTLYQKKLIVVKRRMVTSDASDKLRENDIILSVDGAVVSLIREFYSFIRGKDKVKLKIFRDSEELDIAVETAPFSTLGTTRILHCGGLILQDPHSAIFYLSTQEILSDGGVYVTHQEEGSPATTAEAANENLTQQHSIVGKMVYKVNGQNVNNLEEFKKVIVQTKHEEFVRLVARDITRGEESVHDIRLDLEYWKTRDMYLDEEKGWVSEIVKHDS